MLAPPTPQAEEPGAGSPEKSLASLRSFACIAWEECREPLSEAVGAAQVRWEIYSTWKLLLCLHHAEAEAERCLRLWQPRTWHTEAQALRHVFLSSGSLRRLGAVLRWLRWAHCWGPAGRCAADEAKGAAGGGLDEDAECLAGPASFERTRRALQLKGALPRPLEGPPALHPDGPLQQREQFHVEDLEDERRLLLHLWIHLRRGDLKGALRLCADGGQPWRTALLQGMMPFAHSDDEPVGYDDMEEDDMASLKERHSDWTELGVLDDRSTNNGNPWRRLWKEQCWDTADRNLQQGGHMDAYELAVYGLCSGHLDALAPACGGSWGDCCFGELHCLKEWLVERLLSDGRLEWGSGADVFLGEGDGGHPDEAEVPAGRARRAAKLHGRLGEVPGDRLEEEVAKEVRRLLERLRSEVTPPRVRGQACAPFAQLQAELIQAAWRPEGTRDAALGMLRSWIADSFDGAPCPFLVKQFACYFAIWQKDVAPAPLDVDDVVESHVRELIAVASGSGLEQCMRGSQVELIAEHVTALSVERRLDAYVSFLLSTCSCADVDADDIGGAELAALRASMLMQCLQAFWARFPREAFALLAVLARRALRLESGLEEEKELPDIGPVGVSAAVCPAEVSLALQAVVVFWLVLRDKAAARADVEEALAGLRLVLGEAAVPEPAAAETAEDFARLGLERVVLPLLVDSLLILAARDPAGALEVLPALQESMLWRDVISCGARCGENLSELVWYLELFQRQRSWAAAHAAAEVRRSAAGLRLEGYGLDVRVAAGATGEELAQAEQLCSAARGGLLDWALPRLARDKPLLSPLPDTHTLLPEQQWERLRRAVASQVLFLLLSVFEGEGDFDGAMNDLSVAVAQSPWMLKLLQPQQLRAFLRRFALMPTGAGRVEAAL